MMKRMLTAAALTAALLGAGTAIAAPPSAPAKPSTVRGVVTELIDGTVTVQLTLTPEQKKAALVLPHLTHGMPVGPGRLSTDKNEIFGAWRIDYRNVALGKAIASFKGGQEVILEFDSHQLVTKVERAKP